MPNASYWIAVASAPTQSSINSQSIQGQTIQYVSTNTYVVGLYDKSITFNGTATCTVTLPIAGQYPGREIHLKTTAAFTVISASSNVFPLATNTAGTAILPATAGKYAKLVSDGYFWIIMEAN
jgi:hypothetical protein